MRVVVVDPGPHTGIAVWEDVTKLPGGGEFFSAWECGYWEAVEFVTEEFASSDPCDVLVCESFQITVNTGKKSTADSLRTIEMIGILRYQARLAGVPFETQKPADAAAFTTRQKLLNLGWWTVGSDHARSATKHMVLYLVKHDLISPDRVLST